MPPAPPTCAARIIRNEPLQNGWGTTLSGETNEVVSKVRKYAKDCYVFQLQRERPVDASSLSSALFWEHRHIPRPRVVSTPTADYRSLFCVDKKVFNENFGKIQQKVKRESIELKALFGPMRDREFTIWPVQVPESNSSDENKYWVSIIMRIQPKPTTVKGMDKYFDREVTDIAIVDPLSKNRDSRKKFVERKLEKILAQGCIGFSETAVRHNIETEDVEDTWTTGYVAYAICRELFRRLKVLIYRRQHSESASTEFLWSSFEEAYNIDTYRESLMAACAHQAIEKSGYLVRMALDVPSEKTNHRPDALSHLKARSVTSPPEDVPDEDYTESAPKVIVQIPEEMRSARNLSVEQSESDEFASEDSDSGKQSKREKSIALTSPSTSTHSKESSPRSPSTKSFTEDIDLPDYEEYENQDTTMADSANDEKDLDIISQVSEESPGPSLPIINTSTSVMDFAYDNENENENENDEGNGNDNGNENERPHKHPLEDTSEEPFKKLKLAEDQAENNNGGVSK
ncbi:hypothetical protein F4818DRAFT_455115 [Hypoxylon cercidicola]|nr:hypothetical protein F4818DRAFT_455115 [Hypoxylon cercidicola]